jgi:cell division protein FtsL
MTLRRVIIVAAAFIILGILTVWQHVQLVQIGRRIHNLEADKTKLEQEYRKLKIESDRMKSPVYLGKKAGELGYEVRKPRKKNDRREIERPVEQNQAGVTRE